MANPFGFRPVGHLHGAVSHRAKTYIVDDNNPHPIFVGHAVELSSGKVVEHSSETNNPILGVVAGVYSNTENRPRTHSLPDNGNFIPASTRAFVSVWDDPYIIYEAVASGSATNAQIGQLCDITATGSGNPLTGRSRMRIDNTTIAAQTSANIQTLPFMIRDLSEQVDASGRADFEDGQIMEVIINDHVFNRKFPT